MKAEGPDTTRKACMQAFRGLNQSQGEAHFSVADPQGSRTVLTIFSVNILAIEARRIRLKQVHANQLTEVCSGSADAYSTGALLGMPCPRAGETCTDQDMIRPPSTLIVWPVI